MGLHTSQQTELQNHHHVTWRYLLAHLTLVKLAEVQPDGGVFALASNPDYQGHHGKGRSSRRRIRGTVWNFPGLCENQNDVKVRNYQIHMDPAVPSERKCDLGMMTSD